MRIITALLCFFMLQLAAKEFDHDPFVIHVIPKCGTHYIQKIMYMLTNKSNFNSHVSRSRLEFSEKSGKILRIFTPYHERDIQTLKRSGYKAVVMIRDPRDGLISLLLHVRNFTGKKRDFFTVPDNFDTLGLDEQLKVLLVGTTNSTSYAAFFKQRAGWALDRYTLTVRYEDLVGDAGGSTDAIKRKELQRIVDYLHIDVSPERFEWTFANMYTKTPDVIIEGKTFERANIGGWKKYFNKDLKRLFKEHLGNTLIKLGYEKDLKW